MKLSKCAYEVYQVKISSDLAVGLTVINAVHAWHTSLAMFRSLAHETSIIPQPSVHSFNSDKEKSVHLQSMV